MLESHPNLRNFLRNFLLDFSGAVLITTSILIYSLNINIPLGKDTIFWLTSTIIQGFLALTGVIGIFIVYRLGFLEKERLKIIGDLTYLLKREGFESYLGYMTPKEVKEFVKSKLNSIYKGGEFYRIFKTLFIRPLRSLYSIDNSKKRMYRRIIYPIGYNAMLVLISLILLPLNNFLLCSHFALSRGSITLLVVSSIIILWRNIEFIYMSIIGGYLGRRTI